MSRPTNTQPYDYTHPEKYLEGLEWYCDTSVDDLRKQRANFRSQGLQLPRLGWGPQGWGTPIQLCRACGWSTHHETLSGYMPRVKIFHARGAMGMWALGSKWLLRDEPRDGALGSDTTTQMYIREHPDLDIPLPKVMQVLSDPEDQIQLTLMSRCEGHTLASVWSTLGVEQKANYSRQLADILKQIRRITAPRMQKVDGGQMCDHLLGMCERRHYPTCKTIPYTREAWITSLTPDVRKGIANDLQTQDPKAIDERFDEIIRQLPEEFGPYVLTHGDLNMTNIMVKDDKIEAVIDWEFSGFLPWWAERWLNFVAAGDPYKNDELFTPVWAEIYPGLDHKTFCTEIVKPLNSFGSAFRSCPRDHIDLTSHFQRPKWCECKPYGGKLKAIDIGQTFTHKAIEEDDDAPHSWERSGYSILNREERAAKPGAREAAAERTKAFWKTQAELQRKKEEEKAKGG